MDSLKIGQKGGDLIFSLKRGGIKKRGDMVYITRGDKENLLSFFNFFKGKSNFQGILN